MLQPEVLKTVAALKLVYQDNTKQWDFIAAQYISGDDKTGLRQEIIRIITGEKRPLTKCSVFATADVLKNSFNQISLF